MKNWIYNTSLSCGTLSIDTLSQNSLQVSSSFCWGNVWIERSLNTLLSSNSFGNVTQSTISTAGIRNGHSRLRSLSNWLYALMNDGCPLLLFQYSFLTFQHTCQTGFLWWWHCPVYPCSNWRSMCYCRDHVHNVACKIKLAFVHHAFHPSYISH